MEENKLYIKTDLSHALGSFKTSLKTLSLRMGKAEMEQLYNMLNYVIEEQIAENSDYDLEIIILQEIRVMLLYKYNLVLNRANVPLSCSQARTLFIWLAEINFVHPLDESLSAWVVDQIYKQVI